MLRGLAGFAGHSSLRTWLFRILVNRARTVARREGRTLSFSDAFGAGPGDDPLPPSRFQHPLAPGHWTEPVRPWSRSPEEDVLDAEALAVVEAAVEALPAAQRAVITLRDIEGWEAGEVCNALGITRVHQRVLLHRARTRVRAALERYFDRAEP
jgi:RNA polymerase sigma-70 factor (ECF subfamily)